MEGVWSDRGKGLLVPFYWIRHAPSRAKTHRRWWHCSRQWHEPEGRWTASSATNYGVPGTMPYTMPASSGTWNHMEPQFDLANYLNDSAWYWMFFSCQIDRSYPFWPCVNSITPFHSPVAVLPAKHRILFLAGRHSRPNYQPHQVAKNPRRSIWDWCRPNKRWHPRILESNFGIPTKI